MNVRKNDEVLATLKKGRKEWKMKIIVSVKKNEETIIDALKKTENIEEVAHILKSFKCRGILIEIINALLNELSETEVENKQLLNKLKELKKEEEIELLW